MLLQFAVENHKSIRERVVLSMLAADHVEVPADRCYDVPGVGKVLKAAALYGANASGKSNLVDAWALLGRLVTFGVQPGRRISMRPFKLEKEWATRPTRFDVEFWAGAARWRYALVVDAERVHHEALDVFAGDAWREVFRREAATDSLPRVSWGAGLEVDADRATFYRVLGEGTRHEQPVLAEARQRNATELEAPCAYLSMAGYVADVYGADKLPEAGDDGTRMSLISHNGFRGQLEALLRELSTGVARVGLRFSDSTLQERYNAGEVIRVEEIEETLERGETARTLFFADRGRGAFELHELSAGTRRLIDLAGLLYTNVLEQGVAAFVDEIDRSFHTSLTRAVVGRFLRKCTTGGQLIFTTHDTNLLDAGLLGADGVWFVEKDAEGATRIHSLAEFDPDELAQLTGHLEDGYLEGRFGGIPFLGDPQRLGWTAAK